MPRVADDLCWLSALDLVRLVREQKVSPVEVIDQVLARIARLNPRVNAYCTVTEEEAREAAVAAEVAVMTGESLGPLHGVPVSVKDTLFTRHVRTTGGSSRFAEHFPEEDAVVVERLKGAGAIIVGKTNTPEFAHKAVTDNPLFGATRNPWDPSLTSGGSSGGAGAAVAAGLGPLGVGTDAGGSIRLPAAFCGIYGLKPSFGRVPNGPGFGGEWDRFSCTGPMTRTVRDAALMLDVMAGPDERDRYSLPAPAGDSFLAACDAGIAGLSVAWSADLGRAKVDPVISALCEDAAANLDRLGCHVEVVMPTWDDPEPAFRVLAAAELWAAWKTRLTDGAPLDRSLASLLRAGERVTATEYLDALEGVRALWTDVHRFLARFDFLVMPTVAVPPFAVDGPFPKTVNGEPISPLGWMPFTFPWNLTGQPAASVPIGFTAAGLPIGLQIVGRRHADASVLAASAAIEAATPWVDRRPPDA
jgi:aspartyl-tRNA(Asn)/glutamyl-tRNA(Gln) amidotransferase subunit A